MLASTDLISNHFVDEIDNWRRLSASHIATEVNIDNFFHLL